MRRFSLSFLFTFIYCFSFAQDDSVFHSEIKFIQHLINNDDWNLANEELFQFSSDKIFKASKLDTLNYLKGWIAYNKKKLDTSIYFLNKVSVTSPFYSKAKFYQGFNYAYTGKYAESENLFLHLESDTGRELSALRNFEMAGLSLLKRDYQKFESLSANFKGDYFPITMEENSFKDYYSKIKTRKKKSPFVAGALSALLPGAGKFYTGFKGQGAAALMTVAALGLVAAESYYRAGPKSPQFIAFAGVFSIFYIGNIWGSVTSVKKRDDAFFKELDRNILLDMHIPLRRVFN